MEPDAYTAARDFLYPLMHALLSGNGLKLFFTFGSAVGKCFFFPSFQELKAIRRANPLCSALFIESGNRV